jgi:hypothetical protein
MGAFMLTAQKTRTIRNVLIVMCAIIGVSSTVRADEYYAGGDTVDINRDVLGFLYIADATVNLHENAWVKSVYGSEGQVWADSGSTLNIYGGKIDEILIVTGSAMPAAQVTVFGSAFAINGNPIEPGTPEVLLREDFLSGVYETGTAFGFYVDCYWLDDEFLTVKLAWLGGAPALPKIEAAPEAIEFGQVEVGVQQSAFITVANTGDAPLTVESLTILQGEGTDFGFMPLEQLPLTIAPDSRVEVEVVFMPSAEGPYEAIFQIVSDDPEKSLVEVMLTGTGFVMEEPELTVKEKIDVIRAFYNAGIKDGTIVGTGPRKTAEARVAVVDLSLAVARNLIFGGYNRLALMPLESVAAKTDGKVWPCDFVAGPSAPELNAMVEDLIDDIKGEYPHKIKCHKWQQWHKWFKGKK